MTNEINAIFMTLIESTLNKMIDNRIETQAGADMKNAMKLIDAQAERIAALENYVLPRLVARIEALEEKTGDTTATIDLDNQEFRDAVKRIAESAAEGAIESAMSDHCSDYDHDDIEAAKETDEDAVTDIIKEYLRNVTVRLDV